MDGLSGSLESFTHTLLIRIGFHQNSIHPNMGTQKDLRLLGLR
jgi:hypothetical protein